jgi:fatty acid/phospholipid synthesis protein PlsX
MRIAFDAMGGDYAPKLACLGALSFLKEFQDTHVLFIGNEEMIRAELNDEIDANLMSIIHTNEVIDMHEHPTKAMKEKQQASMVLGFGLLSQGKADAFVSAGNTGVMLVGATQIIKPIQGVLRPTILTPLPQIDDTYSIMLDVGINADCKPEHLNQFATLGSIYVKAIQGKEKPSVALLNIGEEETKGNLLAQSTHPLLKANENIHFIGNIEGRDILDNAADIIVTDGFTGNIVLKFAESLYDVIRVKKGVNHPYLDKFNHKLYAGVPVLGINKPVVVGHGVSDEVSFKGMLNLARKMILTQLCEKVKTVFESVVSE